MKLILLFMFLFLSSVEGVFSQEVRKVDEKELQSILTSDSDKLYIINFWATWCGPCVTELPYFEKVSKEFNSEKVEFLLASLDFPSQYERRLVPFVKKHNLTIPVVMITETDYDKWMRDVDADWQGNIPATLFFNNRKQNRQFVARPLDDKELRQIIHTML